MKALSGQVMINGPSSASNGNNYAFFSAGAGPIYGNLSLSYEQIVFRGSEHYFREGGMQVGLGLYAMWEDTGWDMLARYLWISGYGNSHLEIGAGVTFMQYLTSSDFNVLPAGIIGYRWEKKKSGLVFRTGAALPEGIYLGIGYRFGSAH